MSSINVLISETPCIMKNHICMQTGYASVKNLTVSIVLNVYYLRCKLMKHGRHELLTIGRYRVIINVCSRSRRKN
jgi:hypothetical protein